MKTNLFYSLGWLFHLGWGALLFIVLLALLKHFVFDIMPISGASMSPNILNRDIVLFNKISYVTGEPKRGDAVVLRFPGDPERQRYIKRIIAMPGETIRIDQGKILINDEPLFEPYIPEDFSTAPDLEVTLGPKQYFLIGDNRPVSSDSRTWGPASRHDFIGKAFLILLPFNRFDAVPVPVY